MGISAGAPLKRHLMFSVDHVRCALPLAATRIVLRMVAMTPPLQKKHGLAGTINVHGENLPVYSVRSLFGLRSHLPRLTDRLIVTETGTGRIAFWVDEAHVIQQNPVLPPQTEVLEKVREVVPGISLTDGGVFIIEDPARFISAENAACLRETAT